jgi:hypothetical protein
LAGKIVSKIRFPDTAEQEPEAMVKVDAQQESGRFLIPRVFMKPTMSGV